MKIFKNFLKANKVNAYLDGEVSPKEKFEIENEIKNDSELKKEYEDLFKITQNIKELPEEKPTDDFEANLYARIAKDNSVDKVRLIDYLTRPAVKKVAYTFSAFALLFGFTLVFMMNINNNNVDKFVEDTDINNKDSLILSTKSSSKAPDSYIEIDLLKGTFTVNKNKSYKIDRMEEYLPKMIKDICWYLKERKDNPQLAQKILDNYNMTDENLYPDGSDIKKVVPVND